MKISRSKTIFCDDMNRYIVFNDNLERFGETQDWFGFRECQLFWSCPHRATCKKHYIPIKQTR